MRILHVTSADGAGGGETHLATLVAGLVARGHDVSVVARPDAAVRGLLGSPPAARLHALSLRGGADLLSAVRLAALARAEGREIVHAHGAHDYPRAALAAAHAGAAFVATRHVLHPLGRFRRFVLRRAAAVVAVSEPTRAALLRAGLSPERVRVVEHGFDVARFAAASPEVFRATLPFEPAAPLVGVLGSLGRDKGQDLFLRAARDVAAARPDARFVVAGGDPARDLPTRAALGRLAADLGLVDRVAFAPATRDAAPVVKAVDVVVSASRTEAFGLVVAEAMAAGRGVVAAATPGAAALLRDGVTGLLVPTEDAEALAAGILRLLDDAPLRARLGAAAASEAAVRFSAERMVAATEALYAEVFASRARASRRASE